MPLKDRFRRALRISGPNASAAMPCDSPHSDSNSSLGSSSSQTRQPTPVITLTKTKTGSSLSKRLTGRSEKGSLEKEKKRREREWEAFAPRKFLYLKTSKEREAMKGFEWKYRDSIEGARTMSLLSGISPGTSRRVSMEDGLRDSDTEPTVETRENIAQVMTNA